MNAQRDTAPLPVIGAIPTAVIVTMIVHFAARTGELPSPMASHWDLSGQPNDSMSPALFTLLLIGLVIVVGWSALSAIRSESDETESFLSVSYGISGLLGYAHWSGIEANSNASSWEQANELTLADPLIALGTGVLFGTAGWFVGRRFTSGSTEDITRQTLDLKTGQRGVWIASTANPILGGLGIAVIVGAVITWSMPSVAIALIGLVLLWSSQVRVTASDRGVTIGVGPVAWPSRTVPLTGLEGAEPVMVSPLSYGGWGYRARPGVRAVIVRGGEGIRLQRPDKSDLIITVPDSDQGARLVNTLTERADARY